MYFGEFRIQIIIAKLNDCAFLFQIDQTKTTFPLSIQKCKFNSSHFLSNLPNVFVAKLMGFQS
jgi:hypothetical protein